MTTRKSGCATVAQVRQEENQCHRARCKEKEDTWKQIVTEENESLLVEMTDPHSEAKKAVDLVGCGSAGNDLTPKLGWFFGQTHLNC